MNLVKAHHTDVSFVQNEHDNENSSLAKESLSSLSLEGFKGFIQELNPDNGADDNKGHSDDLEVF